MKKEEFKTNHVMVKDKNDYIYCKWLDKVVKWDNEYFEKNCMFCPFFGGIPQNEGVIECLYDDGSDAISVTIDRPFEFANNNRTLGFRKSK